MTRTIPGDLEVDGKTLPGFGKVEVKLQAKEEHKGLP